MQVPPFPRKALHSGFLEGPPSWLLLWGPRVVGTLGGGWAHNWNRRAIHPRAKEQPPSSGSQKVATGSCLTEGSFQAVLTHLPCSNCYSHSSQPSIHPDRWYLQSRASLEDHRQP